MSQSKSNDRKKIGILVVNHKAAFIPENDLLIPIQVGASLTSHRIDGVSHYDNDGENISDNNRSYCELTATYWAWKNLKADYYGLFHYRRYLSFGSEQKTDPFASRAYPTVPAALEDIDLTEETMRKVIEAHDIILPRKEDIRRNNESSTIYDQYEERHNISDLDYCIDFIKEHYPDIAPYTETLHTSVGYFYNMFIMKKELFEEYCSFIFDVLGNFEANNDISQYNVQQYRVTGYLAERLTNVFIQYLLGQDKYKVKELQTIFIENTDPERMLEPVAEENNIAVVLAANNFYVPYVSTLLHSLANHADVKKTYDITIFHRDITPANQALLAGEFSDNKNIHVRFYDMSSRTGEYASLFTKWHFTVETYFRLFIQDIMTGYEKVLYLDGDMIIKNDIAELYEEDVEGYILAACKDIDMAGIYNSNILAGDNTIDPGRKDYLENDLKLKDPLGYFQAGVLLLNLKEMRKSFSARDTLKFAASRQWEYLDQDVLNYFAQGKVKYLAPEWNVLYDWEFKRIKDVISLAPIEMYLDYIDSRKHPKIIHYGGTIKPWQRADTDFANEYWKIARGSEYYELILGRMADWRAKHPEVPVKAGESVRLRTRIVRKMRRAADRVAPKGTAIRKPITATSRYIKRYLLT